MNLAALLKERAKRHPDRIALVDLKKGKDRSVSFRELSRRVRAGAAYLDAAGLKKGSTVLVFQPVSIELYEFLLSAFHCGVRVMLADPSAGRKFLQLCCQRVKPDAFFGSWKAQLLRLSTPGLRQIPVAICSEAWFPGAKSWSTNGEEMPLLELPDSEPALITFTSGSTGVPKAAVRTHGFLLAQHRTLSKALAFEEGEVDLITLPVFVLANLASGLTSVLAATDLAKPGTPDVTAVAAQCERHQVTRCAASPAFFEGMLNGGNLPRLGKLYTGGAPVFPVLLRRLKVELPWALVHAVYGSTEAEPIAHFSAGDADDSTDVITRSGGGLCSGIPVPEIRVKIIRDQWGTHVEPMDEESFESLAATPGQAGEIVVSGDHVLRGYLDGAGDQETKIHVGEDVWHRTGDAGWIDPAGRVWLLGRCSEKMSVFSGKDGLPADALRYPFAVECALREVFPEARMAALDREGRRTLAVEGNEGMSGWSEMLATAQAMGMDQVIALASIPLDRRHNAKIDYPALRSLLAAYP